jgi:hypothetical protein
MTTLMVAHKIKVILFQVLAAENDVGKPVFSSIPHLLIKSKCAWDQVVIDIELGSITISKKLMKSLKRGSCILGMPKKHKKIVFLSIHILHFDPLEDGRVFFGKSAPDGGRF